MPFRRAMRENFRKKKKPLTKTAEEYASHTSIHGIPYVFDRELSYLDRFLWLLLTLAFLSLAIALTWNTWTQWREEQVCPNMFCILLSNTELLQRVYHLLYKLANYFEYLI